MNFDIEEKVSILLLEKSVEMHILISLEEELDYNDELRREYWVQKSIKSLLSRRLKQKCSIEQKHNELKRKLNFL